MLWGKKETEIHNIIHPYVNYFKIVFICYYKLTKVGAELRIGEVVETAQFGLCYVLRRVTNCS